MEILYRNNTADVFVSIAVTADKFDDSNSGSAFRAKYGDLTFDKEDAV